MTLRICEDCKKEEDIKRTEPTPKCRKCMKREEGTHRPTKREIRNKRKHNFHKVCSSEGEGKK